MVAQVAKPDSSRQLGCPEYTCVNYGRQPELEWRSGC